MCVIIIKDKYSDSTAKKLSECFERRVSGQGVCDLIEHEKEDGFVIDKAKESAYQNQDDEYYKAYLKWRSDSTNPYSFSYVRDTREHSYMAGQGYIKVNADTAETITLKRCLGLVGMVMILMLVFDIVTYMMCRILSPYDTCNIVYYSERYSAEHHYSLFSVLIYTGFNIVKYIVAILILKIKMDVPNKVAMPKMFKKDYMTFNAVVIMLMVTVITKLAGSGFSQLLDHFNVDSVYCYMFMDLSMPVMVISFIYNCIVFPVLCEILFRGFVMQSFRQFGDSYAIVISTMVCCFSFYDFSHIGYMLCCSIVLGIFTMRTGSLSTAIFMHVLGRSFRYIISLIALIGKTEGRFIDMVIYLVICACTLVIYFRFNNSKTLMFDIDPQLSDAPFTKKMERIFSSNILVVWLAFAVIMTIVMMRFE